MQEMGLKSRVSKGFTPTTTQADPSKQPPPNLLNRDFHAEAPNRKWATDITYLATTTGWVYLAVVMDLFSRKIVGWTIGASLATELVADALRKAIELRRPDGKQLLHHSDRGCQYTSDVSWFTVNWNSGPWWLASSRGHPAKDFAASCREGLSHGCQSRRGEKVGRSDSAEPPALRSWPLGRRSGRTSALPYPPPRSSFVVIGPA
jgi:hypothetical protein